MKRYQKVLLILCVFGLLVAGSIQVYITYFLDDQIESVLKSRFQAATDEQYELTVGELDLEIFGRELNISNINIRKKDGSQSLDISTQAEKLALTGISFTNLIFSQELRLKQIKLINPTVNVTTEPSQPSNSATTTDMTQWSRRFSAVVLQVLENVTIPDLQVRGLSVTYNRSDLPINPYLTFDESRIHLKNIVIDSALVSDNRILPAETISASFNNIRHHTANELYRLSVEQANISSADQTVRIESVQVTPRYSKEQFAFKVGHEIDRMQIEVPSINWQEINVSKLNLGEKLAARRIQIQQPDINIHRDKRPPFPPDNNPPLPQQMIRNIPFALAVDTLAISDGHIRYSERLPEGTRSGHISFTNLSATLHPLNNTSGDSAFVTTMRASTNIMDEARLQAKFSFPMNSNQHHVSGQLDSMAMKHLNPALEPLGFVRIDNGQILGLDFDMHLNPDSALGETTFRYHDLKVSLLDKESNRENFGKKVVSLLANTFKVKSNNTGPDPRTTAVAFKRDPQKSIFNYWWKSLLSGLKASIGA
jgi:hypothetical protein